MSMTQNSSSVGVLRQRSVETALSADSEVVLSKTKQVEVRLLMFAAGKLL